jgi:hypothetical protein
MTVRSIRRWLGLGALLLALVYSALETRQPSSPGAGLPQDDEAVLQLHQAQRSGEVVEGSGTVDRLLSDDRDGSRHQRFILRLDSDLSLLVAHNLDLAPRIDDIEPGDRIEFRGQYEWNDQGGVIHWTHHDPSQRRPGGWLEHRGETYR